jgi:hypothetical protein
VAPMSTAGNMSWRPPGAAAPCPTCCSVVKLSAAASGTASATSVPASDRPLFASCPNIQAMPTPPTAIASQVRAGSRWRRNRRLNRAVINGPMAMVTSTLATVVRVMASMKAVNITAQQTPENHTCQPARSRPDHSPGPRMPVSSMPSASALKALRQKVTSKLPALSRCRATTPAMLHSRVTSTIRATARRCDMRMLSAAGQP